MYQINMRKRKYFSYDILAGFSELGVFVHSQSLLTNLKRNIEGDLFCIGENRVQIRGKK